MMAMSYDNWCWVGRLSREHNPFQYGSIDDLDIHDAAIAACGIAERHVAIDTFLAVIKQKLEMPPMFDGMTI